MEMLSIIYFIHAHKNTFMVLFEFPLSIWVLKFIVYIKVKVFFCYKKKIKLAEPSVLSVSMLLELFWICCFLSGSIVCFGVFLFSYLISVLVCAMWYQETAFCLLSYEKAAQKKTSFIM